MSLHSEPLPRKTIIAWRNFAQTADFQRGIDWLRHSQAPRVTGADEVEILKSALGWGAYMQALEDVEDKLTTIPKQGGDLDEAPLDLSRDEV